MDEIPKHYYKKQWYKDIEFNIEPITDVFEKVGEKLFKPHRLDFHQFLFVTEGTGEHEVDFNTIHLKPNTIVPLVIGQVQRYKKNPNLRGYIIAFTSNFLIYEQVNLKYQFDFSTFNTLLKPQQLQCSSELVHLIHLLNDAFSQKNEFQYEEVLRSYLKLIILKLEQTKRKLVSNTAEASIILSQKFNKELENKISYKTKISDVCESLGVDYKKVTTAIKQATNKTPKQLLDERVVLELKRLLVYTDLTIKEIAYQTGFEEASNLANYFKKRTGLSPSEFKSTYDRN